MLQPARTKYRKLQKGRVRGLAKRGAHLSFGEYGLQALERGRVTSRQIEAGRIAMARLIKKGGKIYPLAWDLARCLGGLIFLGGAG